MQRRQRCAHHRRAAKEYRTTLRPEVMSALHIVPDTISAALARTNFLSSDGWLFNHACTSPSPMPRWVRWTDSPLVISNDGKRIVRLGTSVR
ncbi:MAG: hypothetical protein IPI05_05550 [Flavobacteriales bacterium]|nr:hypothetical protein [Flavobacteriales bacterium]